MTAPTTDERTLEVAAEVAELLLQHEIPCALIGAIAVAVHGYARATEDVDIATDADPFTQLVPLKKNLQARGYEVVLDEPDQDDPLGGTLTVTGEGFDPVQVVNLYNPLSPVRNPGGDAVRSARELLPGTTLKVVDLPHLIALKLYSGSWG